MTISAIARRILLRLLASAASRLLVIINTWSTIRITNTHSMAELITAWVDKLDGECLL